MKGLASLARKPAELGLRMWVGFLYIYYFKVKSCLCFVLFWDHNGAKYKQENAQYSWAFSCLAIRLGCCCELKLRGFQYRRLPPARFGLTAVLPFLGCDAGDVAHFYAHDQFII